MSKVKYLEIVINEILKWSEYVNGLTKGIRNLINKFYILREFMCKKLLMLVYGSLVESFIRYGIIEWGGFAYESNLKPLKVIQNTILKVVFHKDRRYPTRQLYDEGVCNIAGLYVLLYIEMII